MRQWVYMPSGKGWQVEGKILSKYAGHFPKNAVGLVQGEHAKGLRVWLIGRNEEWVVPSKEVKAFDIAKTGDKHKFKVCNVCHCRLSVESFAPNQTNKHGRVRRPSCKRCRTDIDKRAPKSKQAKDMEKRRPPDGEPFQCPICRKRSIAGITAKVVADHNHHTGDVRDFICDSCNTGLGRFKNGENYLQNAIEYLKARDDL